MKRIGYAETREDRGVEINMSPLIDCVFLLLIFFIVTTVFVDETGVEVEKPRAASAEDISKHSMMMSITSDGRIFYGGRQISLNSVRGLVARQIREKQVPVILIADEGCRSGRLVDVVDECKLAGAARVSIAADRE
jgi:biopolymer transport protein ExbD